MSKHAFILLTALEKGRLDKVLSVAACARADSATLGLSRARLQALIKEGHARLLPDGGEGEDILTCDGRLVADPSFIVDAGQRVAVTLPPAASAAPEPQAMTLAVVYEDDDLLVLDKPAGLVVHPAAGHREGTLVNALLAHCGASLSGIGGVARPGIVHRLDKDTSGLMVVAKNDFAHQKLSAQFADRTLSRVYQALVWGVPQPLVGEVEGAIGRHPRARQKMAVLPRGGKPALTRYKTLETFGSLVSLVSCSLATGRTHQIRVHMAFIGHALVGDPVYGGRKKIQGAAGRSRGLVATLQAFPRQALHAGEITFLHPRAQKRMTFKTPLPCAMKALLKTLRAHGDEAR